MLERHQRRYDASGPSRCTIEPLLGTTRPAANAIALGKGNRYKVPMV